MITILKGFVIGVANIIPGVSGGTLALVLGIYERTIKALYGVDLPLARAFCRAATLRPGSVDGLRAELRRVDALFLCQVGVGAVAAILATSKLMAYVLDRHHAAAYAFFFGLVLFSMVFPYRYLKRKSPRELVAFVLAAALTVSLTFGADEEDLVRKAEAKQTTAPSTVAETSSPSTSRAFLSFETPDLHRAVVVFLSAALAISAMILPGISGSFVLLLLGVYFDILAAINERQVVILAIFALGCVVGLLIFSRIMNLLLEKFYSVTMAFMIGLMAGSLYVLWPFKRLLVAGGEKIYLDNIWPSGFGQAEWSAVLAAAAGAAVILVFCLIDRNGSNEQPVGGNTHV